MPKTIKQKIIFKNITSKDLYSQYMNAELHSLITGAQTKIFEKEGTSFSAHSGYITGRNLQLIKNKLIVQTWRATDWNRLYIDSTFILYLQPEGENGIVYMTHANVPDKPVEKLMSDLKAFFWKPCHE